MSRAGRPGRGPRIPTWLLVLGVLVALGGAGWLFSTDLRDGRDDPGTTTTARDEAAQDDSSVLDLPKGDTDEEADDDSEDDTRRRGTVGRDRLDETATTGTDTAATTDGDTAEGDAAELPATAVNLKARRIVLAPASATASGATDRFVRLDGARVPCAGTLQPKELAAELALLDRIERSLQRAGAEVVRLDDDDHQVSCVDLRVKLQARGYSFVVLDSAATGPARVLPARVAGGATNSEARAAGARLAGELAAALDLRRPPTTTTPASSALLARAGAVQSAGGAPGALVQLGIDDQVTAAQLDELAAGIVAGLAADATAAGDRQSPDATAG